MQHKLKKKDQVSTSTSHKPQKKEPLILSCCCCFKFRFIFYGISIYETCPIYIVFNNLNIVPSQYFITVHLSLNIQLSRSVPLNVDLQ